MLWACIYTAALGVHTAESKHINMPISAGETIVITGAGAGLVLVVHPDPAWHERFVAPAGWTAHRVRLGAEGLRTELAA